MGNKHSSDFIHADADLYAAVSSQPSTPSSGKPRLSKNKSLSALTAMAKNRLTSSSALGRRKAPSSAKLERSSRFTRSVTSGDISGFDLDRQQQHLSNIDFEISQLQNSPVCTKVRHHSTSSSTCSSNDFTSSALVDSQYFVATASRSSVKRLAEGRRGPTMGTHAKSAATLTGEVSSSVGACAPAPTMESSFAIEEDNPLRAPIANALEATLTSCLSADDSFLQGESTSLSKTTPTGQASGSVTNPGINLGDSQASNRTLPWSVSNSSSQLQPPATNHSGDNYEMPAKNSSLTSSGGSSPTTSAATSVPDFGAAQLERLLASLASTPSVEAVPKPSVSMRSNASSSDEDESISRHSHPKNVPWDTFYTTCPWSYDLNSANGKMPKPEETDLDQPSSATATRPHSSADGSNLSTDGTTTPQNQSQLTVPNPRETNRNSCGADSGLGGMELVNSNPQQVEQMPVVHDVDEKQQPARPPSQPRLVPRTVATSSTSSSASSHSSSNSERVDIDDVVSYSCAAPSVSESLMTHADDVTVVENGTSTKRTGWLNVKNYMVRRRDRLELATRRRWTRYWVCLKSSVLLLYSVPDCGQDSESFKTNVSVNAKHFIVIEEVLCQPLPEHPKRDNCFSLSTTSGDVFLLQADSLNERDGWIASIHAACALALTSQASVPSAMRIIRTEVGRLDQAVIYQRQLLDAKKDGFPAVAGESTMQSSVSEWESLLLTSFVLRTYLASMQQAELPNPKTLLAQVSSQTKAVLRKIGAFTVSALHAILSARGLMRSEDILAQQKTAECSELAKGERSVSRGTLHTPDTLEIGQTQQVASARIPIRLPCGQVSSFEWPPASASFATPTVAPTTPIPKGMAGAGVTHTKASNILKHLCVTLAQPPLSAPDHFLMARFKGENDLRIVDRNEVLLLNVIDVLAVEPRSVIRIDMSRQSSQEAFGIEVESELDSDGCEQPQDELMRVFVSRVDADARAASTGIQVGDEILVINNRLCANLSMQDIETFFEQCLNVRLTLRVARRRQGAFVEASESASTSKPIDRSTPIDLVENPNEEQVLYDQQHQQQVYEQSAANATSPCSPDENMKNKNDDARPPQRKPSLTDTQKLFRAFRELIETEYAYIRDMRHLLDSYLAPLRDIVFSHDDNFAALYEAAADVYTFQCSFAQALDDAFHLLPSFRGHHQAADLLLQPNDFRKPLLTLSTTFRYYAAKFKLYSSFSVRHSKCLQILQDSSATSSPAYQQLVSSANPQQQHSMTLESYLIKPIQRILRYPLILEQLRQLSAAAFPGDDTTTTVALGEASRIMAMVAEHVNELQKIFDEFGVLFDKVVTEYRQAFPNVPLALPNSTHHNRAELNIADLEMYGHVEWLENNMKPSRKGREIYSICFVFTEALVIVSKERSKKQGSKSKSNKSSPEQSSPADDELVHYHRLLPLTDVSLRIPPPPSNMGCDPVKHPLWQIVYRIPTSRVSSPSSDYDSASGNNELVFTFANSSYENKQEFVTTISSLIRQVRNSQHELPPPARPQNSRRTQSVSSSSKQRSRSVGRLVSSNRVPVQPSQSHNFEDVYDLQPVHQRHGAPPLPPRHHHHSHLNSNGASRGDGSTSSGGQSDSLNSSIASINNQHQPPVIGHRMQQNRQGYSQPKLMFMSPAGSSTASSRSQQRQNLDPQSSPVWKPRGLAEPPMVPHVQVPARPALRQSTASRSKSPGVAVNERLYWHDSEVTFYNNGSSSAPRNPPAYYLQQQQHQPQQQPQQSTMRASLIKTAPMAQRRSNGSNWFSDCECNMLLSGFDSASANVV